MPLRPVLALLLMLALASPAQAGPSKPPPLSSSPSTTPFDPLIVRDGKSQVVTVTNNGSKRTGTLGVSLTGDYGVGENTCAGAVLAPRATCIVEVAYTGWSAGSTGELRVSTAKKPILSTTTYLESALNSLPVTADDSYLMSRTAPTTVPAAQGVLSNDTDPDGDQLSVTTWTSPQCGSLDMQADGSFTFDPTGGGQSCSGWTFAAFSYAISDGTSGALESGDVAIHMP